MSTFITIIIVILAFSFLIFIHELGHFWMAKRAGIKVIEFAIGFPPRIWTKKKGETNYSINLIPFGGYVKLYGEDATNPQILKSKKSFASKSLRQRIAVVTGGVLMNAITAFILFTIGFTVGMKPLIPDGINSINNGTIEIQSGAVISEIADNSPLIEKNITPNTSIIKINNQELPSFPNPSQILNNGNFEIQSIHLVQNNQVKEIVFTPPVDNLKIKTYQFAQDFPRLKIQKVTLGSASYKSGLTPNDIILQMNNQQITSIEDYNKIIHEDNTINYKILRDWQIKELKVEQNQPHKAIIDTVFQDSPAQKSGILPGDIIVNVNETPITTFQQAITEIQKQEKISLTLKRNNSIITKELQKSPEGLIGISSRPLYQAENEDLSLYITSLPTSFTKINEVRYPLHQASIESLSLMKDLSILTVTGFANAIKSILVNLEVPQDGGGAVAITTMIHKSVQTGFMDFLQLIAYISLVLAVLNILPLPALDGGRLFFLIFEGLVGHKINPRWEAYIHTIGFILLITLILFINYNDFLRLV